MNVRGSLVVSAVGLASLVAQDAGAVQKSIHFEDGLELVDGLVARRVRLGDERVPMAARAAYLAFRADFDGSWVASWDEATAVPLRIWGRGIVAPNANSDATEAARFAEDVLARHIALLAPGAVVSDFVLASNVVSRGQRVVAFLQLEDGMPVIGGQLSFRFKNDRLFVIASEALPHVHATTPKITIDDAAASTVAQKVINDDFGVAAVESVTGPMVLPLIGETRVIGHRVVQKVVVRSHAPVGRFDVYVDAVSGAPVGREQTLRFASGEVTYDVPVRYPLAERAAYPARFALAQVDGASATADALGWLSFADPGPAEIAPGLSSAYAAVFNQSGPLASTLLSLDDGATALWSEPSDPKIDAQLTGFIHAQVIKDFVRDLAPEMSWVNAQLQVHVNLEDTCNAHYDGTAINFYRHNGQCENTGRLPDVIYHEFGHGVHHHAVILGSGDFEGALSEGVSDFLAATFTGDPAMGRGFFYNSQPLRHIDPSKNRVWPDDVVGEVHQDGRIIGETLWDLRKAMIAKLGESEGVAHANDLYYQAIKNASDIPTMYAEVLAADDDDGNLENGTPNVCEIVDAFALHGLRTLNVASSKLAVEPPTQVGHHISLEIEGLFDQCQSDSIDGATVIWHTERKPSVVQTVVMDGGPTLFEGVIAPQLSGEVVRYRVEALLSAGTKLSFPANAADPTYQFFVGEVTPIYCTDFEADPNTYGWTHGLLAGGASEGADDWQWDEPMGGAHNGDPSSAFSGFYVFGNDLGHDNFNGLYQKNKTNFADSPVISVAGFDNVRLQYRRWLNVEDGFFDRATIYANGQPAWQNLATTSDGDTHHTDREWRFHDVDLSDFVSPEGTVQLRWEIASDGNLQMGGWTLDDVCVVAYEGPPPVDPRCGDGVVQPGEGCDDGNVAANDGCNTLCQPEDKGDNGLTETSPDLTVGGGCGCGAAGSGKPRAPLAWILLGLGAMLFRRRRP